MLPPLKRAHLIALLATGSLVAVLLAGLFWTQREHLPPLQTVQAEFLQYLQMVPAPLYFLAFAILPAFCVPLTLFYLTALPILGQQSTTVGIGLAWLALLINMVFTRLLATGLLRPLIEKLLARQGRVLPTWNPKTEWQVVLAVRLSPIPFPLQNYLLALGKARWATYLWLSWPLQCAIGVGVMLVGESLFKGGFGYALLGIFLFLCLNLVLQRYRKKLPSVDVEPAQ